MPILLATLRNIISLELDVQQPKALGPEVIPVVNTTPLSNKIVFYSTIEQAEPKEAAGIRLRVVNRCRVIPESSN